MTNITLSIDNETHSLMRKYPEIKWSEFVRKIIKQRVKELESVKNIHSGEGFLTMLASENILKSDWDNKFDKRWDNV